MIKETIKSGRKEAESLKLIIIREGANFFKLDYECMRKELNNYRKRMEDDIADLESSAKEVYYKVLNEYFTILMRDTLSEDLEVFDLVSKLDGILYRVINNLPSESANYN